MSEFTKYRIAFNLKGKRHIWERFGQDMEDTLKSVKVVLNMEFGDNWSGVAICGPQCGTEVYNF